MTVVVVKYPVFFSKTCGGHNFSYLLLSIIELRRALVNSLRCKQTKHKEKKILRYTVKINK